MTHVLQSPKGRLVLAPLLASWLCPSTLWAGSMTLTEVYAHALQSAESVSMAEKRHLQAEEQLSQANGAMLPNLSGSAVYQKLDDTGDAGFDADAVTTKLTLNQPLFRGMSEYAARRAAEYSVNAREALTDQSKLELYRDVASAFYEVASQRQEIENIKTLKNLTDRRLKDLQQRSRIGRSRDSEVLSARSQSVLLESQLKSTETLLAQARERLHAVAGIPADTDVAVSPEEAVQLKDKLGNLEQMLPQMEKRADLRALKAEASSAEEQIKMARGGHLPNVDLTGNYYIQREGALEDSKWDVSVGLTVPIYSGGIVQSKVREAVARSEEKKLQLRLAERMADTGIRSAYERVRGGLEQLTVLENALKVAEANYKAQLRDYRFSLVTNLEVIQALNSFQESKRTFDRVRFQTLAAYAGLQAELGTLPQK